MITISDLSVVYSNGHVALHDVTLHLKSGRIFGLVGVNGAGKSTLFKAMMGFVKPRSGRVMINDADVKSALRRQMIAYVPQNEEVDWDFPVLVKDVVMMGRYAHMGFLRIPKAQDHQRVEEALKRVDMLDYKDRQIGELSGGQKKRVFVARALAQEAQIIFLDEPFAGVDLKTEENLSQLFKALSKEGKLLVISTHNLSGVPDLCDEVALINKTVLASGSVSDVFTSENLFNAFGGQLRTLSGQFLNPEKMAS